MKRTRQSRATLLESAMVLPIRGTCLCGMPRLDLSSGGRGMLATHFRSSG